MHLIHRRASAALTAALLPLVLVGCGSDAAEPASSATSEQTSDEASETPTDDAATDEAEVEADGDRVGAGGAYFDRPEGWVSVAAEDVVDKAAGDPELDEVAAEMGMSAAQLSQFIGQAELLLLDPATRNTGFADNVNIVVPGGTTPADAEIEQQFTQLGATVLEITRQDSDLGEVVAVPYVLPVGSAKIQGEALVVEVGGEALTITISAIKRAKTDALADGIVSSLAAE